jgi:pescadillo protein
MANIKKKGESGAAVKYITRNQALKKLQLSLSDFRRLCILKGIYPREPRNKKKANASVTSATTFYYTKDILFLAHEPLLAKFREMKVFQRKLKRYLGRREWAQVKALKENDTSSIYSLDHIIRERFPTFVDALRDLDDPLSLVTLFSTLPKTETEGHKGETAKNCAKLMREFEAYIIATGALKKAFISIKGIYYQAEILGQPITWITPHEFSTAIPTDVDFRVMLTFLEFYQSLLGFVNFKLFSRISWPYPAPFLKETAHQSVCLQTPEWPEVERDDDGEAEGPIFRNMVFFLSREVPKSSLAFVIQSLGGKVGWACEDGTSQITEDDPSITHVIVDRPSLNNMLVDRHYVQPQWVFDSLNAKKALDIAQYRVGEVLPPHLSPFVTEEDKEDEHLLEEVTEESLEKATTEEAKKKVAEALEAKEKRRLAESMMSKKHQKLYKQMQHGRQKKAQEKKALDSRKKAADLKKAKLDLKAGK